MLAGIIALEKIGEPLEEVPPALVGPLLLARLPLFGHEVLGFEPAVAPLLETQMLPRPFPGRIEPDDRTVVRERFFFEPVPLAPCGQPHLIVGLQSRQPAAVTVVTDQLLVSRVVLNLLGNLVGISPLPSISDEPHQSPAREWAGSFITAAARCLTRSAERPCASHQSAS